MCAAIAMRTTVTFAMNWIAGRKAEAALRGQDLVATSRRASARTSKTCATAGRNAMVCGGREPEPRPGCRPAGRFPTIRRANSISRRTEMDQDAKKTVLRMIPYGIYVLTADDGKGNVAAATVNWVTQTAFAPPLVVVGVKTDSGA
ncbi:MAG TPA: flavin reductase, partial [Stellaceae bacterium]|nr:flavin reductase [Stellaceae bacterium]